MDDEDMDDEDMDDEDDVDHRISDLEDALEELKAEFERIEGKHAADDEHDEDEDEDIEDEDMDEEDMDDDEGKHEELDEFDNFMESLDLDVLRADLYTGGDRDGEIGSGKFAKPNTSRTSPVAKSRADLMGAKPVKTGQGPKPRGFDLEHAPNSVYGETRGSDNGMPKSAKADNRRKKATDGMSDMSSGAYGTKRVSGSRLETTQDEFKTGKSKSPFYNVKRDN